MREIILKFILEEVITHEIRNEFADEMSIIAALCFPVTFWWQEARKRHSGDSVTPGF